MKLKRQLNEINSETTLSSSFRVYKPLTLKTVLATIAVKRNIKINRMSEEGLAMGGSICGDEVSIKKGPWTPEEDIVLASYIQEHGPRNWRSVPINTGLYISHLHHRPTNLHGIS